jgi:hypothetical protein
MCQYRVSQDEATGEWLVFEVFFAEYGAITVPVEIDRVDSWPTKEAAEAALRSIPTAAIVVEAGGPESKYAKAMR